MPCSHRSCSSVRDFPGAPKPPRPNGEKAAREWSEQQMAYRRSALVTGGAGFIGSHLVDRLVAEGYRVIIVDDLSTGKLKNLNHDANFHHLSITHPSLLDVFKRESPDLVFHLAAQSSVPKSLQEPILDNEVNVLGTLRLLEVSRRTRRRKGNLLLDGRGPLRGPRGDPLPRRRSRSRPYRPTACPSTWPSSTSTFMAGSTGKTTPRCATVMSTARARIPTAKRAWWPYSSWPC